MIFDVEVDVVYMMLVFEIEFGCFVCNEVVEIVGGMVVFNFDQVGMLLGVEVFGVMKFFDGEFFVGVEWIDQGQFDGCVFRVVIVQCMLVCIGLRRNS